LFSFSVFFSFRTKKKKKKKKKKKADKELRHDSRAIPEMCWQCEEKKKNKSLEKWKQHLQAPHSHPCVYACHLMFVSRSSLTKHIRTKHKNDKQKRSTKIKIETSHVVDRQNGCAKQNPKPMAEQVHVQALTQTCPSPSDSNVWEIMFGGQLLCPICLKKLNIEDVSLRTRYQNYLRSKQRHDDDSGEWLDYRFTNDPIMLIIQELVLKYHVSSCHPEVQTHCSSYPIHANDILVATIPPITAANTNTSVNAIAYGAATRPTLWVNAKHTIDSKHGINNKSEREEIDDDDDGDDNDDDNGDDDNDESEPNHSDPATATATATATAIKSVSHLLATETHKACNDSDQRRDNNTPMADRVASSCELSKLINFVVTTTERFHKNEESHQDILNGLPKDVTRLSMLARVLHVALDISKKYCEGVDRFVSDQTTDWMRVVEENSLLRQIMLEHFPQLQCKLQQRLDHSRPHQLYRSRCRSELVQKCNRQLSAEELDLLHHIALRCHFQEATTHIPSSTTDKLPFKNQSDTSNHANSATNYVANINTLRNNNNNSYGNLHPTGVTYHSTNHWKDLLSSFPTLLQPGRLLDSNTLVTNLTDSLHVPLHASNNNTNNSNNNTWFNVTQERDKHLIREGLSADHAHIATASIQVINKCKQEDVPKFNEPRENPMDPHCAKAFVEQTAPQQHIQKDGCLPSESVNHICAVCDK
ncbi:hypothetical protein RFI_12485, partial [Reticulomyxa filosa]